MRQTAVRPFDPETIALAATMVRAGDPVAVPTETVYGLAADAGDADAVARVYAAKGRPAFNPLIVHVADLAAAERLGRFDADARALAAAHWPGPLTLVVPLRADADMTEGGIARIATAGLPTVALRVPAGRAMRALLDATGRPLAAPSANRSGGVSPTRAEHVLASLGGRIGLVIDDGPCRHGLESTVVAATGGHWRLLRAGPIAVPGAVRVAAGDRVEAPGQLARHYSPGKPVRLEATEAAPDEWLVGFGAVAGDASLSPAGDLVEAAARLFDRLHEAASAPRPRIAVAPVPEEGLGAAINDRLRRAAA